MPLQLISRTPNERNILLFLAELFDYILTYTPIHPDLKNNQVLLNYNFLQTDLSDALTKRQTHWFLSYDLDNINPSFLSSSLCESKEYPINVSLYFRIFDSIREVPNARLRLNRIVTLVNERLTRNADEFEFTCTTQLDPTYPNESQKYKTRLSQNIIENLIYTPEGVNKTNFYTAVLDLKIYLQETK